MAETINKKDLELIFQVNQKAVEIQTNVSSQNEEIINDFESLESDHKDMKESLKKIEVENKEIKDLLKKHEVETRDVKDSLKKNEENANKIIKTTDELNKDIFKIQILFLTGFVSIILQLIQLFKK